MQVGFLDVDDEHRQRELVTGAKGLEQRLIGVNPGCAAYPQRFVYARNQKQQPDRRVFDDVR